MKATARLAELLCHRKEFITIDDSAIYKRPRVRLHAQGIVLRDEVRGSQIKTKKQQVCRTGEFLVAEIDAKVGGFGIVPPDLEGAIVSSHYFVFTIREDRLDRRFLHWFTKTPAFREQVEAQGSTNYAAIRPRDVLEYRVPLPPLSEQRRIVARIDELAWQIHECRTARLATLAQTDVLFRAAIASCVTPNGAGWRREKVEDVISSMDAGWSPQCDDVPAHDSEQGVLKTTAVQWCEFRPYENKALPTYLKPIPELVVREGDILVTRAGPRKRVGVVAAVRRDEPFLTISDKIIRLRPNASRINYRFLEVALASPYSQEHLLHRKTGLADAQVNISQSILGATPVAFPSLPEQHRIVTYLDGLKARVDAATHLQEATAGVLDALLPSILDKAFKGEL